MKTLVLSRDIARVFRRLTALKLTPKTAFVELCEQKKDVDLVVLRVVFLGVLLTVKEIWSFLFTIFQMEKMRNQKTSVKNGSILSAAKIFLLPKVIECVLCVFREDVKRT